MIDSEGGRGRVENPEEHLAMTVWVSEELNQALPRVGGWRQAEARESVSDLALATNGYGLIIEPMKKMDWADMSVGFETTHLTQAGASYTFGQGAKWAADPLVMLDGAKGGMRGIRIQTGAEPRRGTPSQLWPIYTNFEWQKGEAKVARIEVAQRQIRPITEWLVAAGMGGWREVAITERVMENWEKKMEQRRADVERAWKSSTTDIAQWLINTATSSGGREKLNQIFEGVSEGPAFNQEIIRMANVLVPETKMMVAFTNWFAGWGAYYLEVKGWRFGERSEFDTSRAIGELPTGLAQLTLDVDFYQKNGGMSQWTGGIRVRGGWRQLAIGSMI